MPTIQFIDEEFACPPVGSAAVRAPAPPKPKARKCKRKPKKRKARPLTAQQQSIIDDRLEAAVNDGRIEIDDDFTACASLDLMPGELVVLARVLFPEAKEADAFAERLFAKLRLKRK